jgi:hypothetical protein
MLIMPWSPYVCVPSLMISESTDAVLWNFMYRIMLLYATCSSD